MSTLQFDTVVIGSGPGGYVCAIKAGQLGQKTAVIEKESIGGVCLNVGCIPSKALIHAGNFYEQTQHHAADMGIDLKVNGIDLSKLKTWKDSVVKKLTGGVGGLLKANKVEVIQGTATFENKTTIKVVTKEGTKTITAKNFVIATGSRPTRIPGFEADGKTVITSTEALDLTNPPKRLCVIGGGYIGLELGTYLSKVGSKVTVLEGAPQLLGSMDQDCVNVVARRLKKRGVEIITGAKAKSYKKTAKGVEVSVETPTGVVSVECDVILVTVGRTPNSEGIGLEKIGLKPNARGFIEIDRQCRTSVPGIYAIGDVAGGMLLAHKASREGIVAAEVISGKKSAFDTTIIPAVVFTDPEIASVGLTEAEAKQKGFDASSAQFPFAALGKALATGDSEGFVKIVVDKKTERMLGVHIVGIEASALLGEAGLALEMGATAEDIALTIHAHPTLPEAIMECAEVALGHPIHIVAKPPRAAEKTL